MTSCVAEFIVYVQVGLTIKNVTLWSNGTGLTNKYSMTFTAESRPTSISSASFNESETSDHVFCGPVIDNVGFILSNGLRLKLDSRFLVYGLIFILATLCMGQV